MICRPPLSGWPARAAVPTLAQAPTQAVALSAIQTAAPATSQPRTQAAAQTVSQATSHVTAPAAEALPLRWPADKPVALAFVVCAEDYDLYPAPDAYTPANVPGGFGRGPYPDYRAFSLREYGNRVGIFRLMERFARVGLKASLAVDGNVASTRRPLLARALALGWDLLGHGVSITEVISERLSASQERDYLQRALAPLRAVPGRTVLGWHGAEYGQSSRTLALLAEEKIAYMLDWPHDERVVKMSTPAGTMLSLPMSADLDDVMAHWHRRISMARWVGAILDSVERLSRDGGDGEGRLLILNLHPWLMGQPYRISHLDDLLSGLLRRNDLWLTTTDEIASHALRQSG